MEELDKNNNVAVYKPDLSLKKKIGNIDLSQALDEAVIKKAEKVVEDSSDKILNEVTNEVTAIKKHIKSIQEKGIFSPDEKSQIVATAFSVKSKAGLCHYTLISELAKSLYLFCETRKDNVKLTKQEVDIISWHGDAISAILSRQIKVSDDDFGRELLSELEKIKASFIK